MSTGSLYLRRTLVIFLMLPAALLAQAGHGLLAAVPIVLAVLVMWGDRLLRVVRKRHASR
jgi:hypothetical protein